MCAFGKGESFPCKNSIISLPNSNNKANLHIVAINPSLSPKYNEITLGDTPVPTPWHLSQCCLESQPFAHRPSVQNHLSVTCSLIKLSCNCLWNYRVISAASMALTGSRSQGCGISSSFRSTWMLSSVFTELFKRRKKCSKSRTVLGEHRGPSSICGPLQSHKT